jgi:ABC-type transport system involved in cytochrome bd biosynthesis fused ATPase/permease subunit
MSNMRYGNELSSSEVLSKIERYGLSSVYSGLSSGVRTEVGVQGKSMSGGMQKVARLLRSMLSESEIVVLDEPLSGLDEKTKSKVIRMIIEECKGKTLIVITHDESIAPYMNRVVDINSINSVDIDNVGINSVVM